MPCTVLFCGDPDARPAVYASACVGLLASRATSSAVHVTSLERAPATLLTDIDVAVLCFSPSRPKTFLTCDQWAPLFSHLGHRVRVLLLATDFETTASAAALNVLQSAGAEMVRWQDVLAAVSEYDVTIGATEISFAAATLQLPCMSWVGRELPPAACVSASLQRLVGILECVALASSNAEDKELLPSVDAAVSHWQELHEELVVDAEEREMLSEYLVVTSDDGTMQVFVSRSTGALLPSMPRELAVRQLTDLQPRLKTVLQCLREQMPEMYVTRRATADADRRRAADRCGKRDTVRDPLLVKLERRSELTRDIQLLERKRDRLRAVESENAQKRMWLADLASQLAASEEAAASEAVDVARHQREMQRLVADHDALISEFAELKQMEAELHNDALPKLCVDLTQDYLTLAKRNKGLREVRDAVNKRIQSVEADVAAQRQLDAHVSEEVDAMWRRIDRHVRDMNEYQDKELSLQAALHALQWSCSGEARELSKTAAGNSRFDENSEWARVYAGREGPGSPLLRLHETVGRAAAMLSHDAIMLCDTVSGPLEIAALQEAAVRERHFLASSVTTPEDLIAFEGQSRLHIVAYEHHERISTLFLDMHVIDTQQSVERLVSRMARKILQL